MHISPFPAYRNDDYRNDEPCCRHWPIKLAMIVAAAVSIGLMMLRLMQYLFVAQIDAILTCMIHCVRWGPNHQRYEMKCLTIVLTHRLPEKVMKYIDYLHGTGDGADSKSADDDVPAGSASLQFKVVRTGKHIKIQPSTSEKAWCWRMLNLPRLNAEIESHLYAWFLVRQKCNINATIQIDRAGIQKAKRSRSNQVGNSGAPMVMSGFIAGLAATELVLALLMLVMALFDESVSGKSSIMPYFKSHLAVEAGSITTIFLTIAFFTMFMVKSGVNCEARQARHATILEQALFLLRFKRTSIRALVSATLSSHQSPDEQQETARRIRKIMEYQPDERRRFVSRLQFDSDSVADLPVFHHRAPVPAYRSLNTLIESNIPAVRKKTSSGETIDGKQEEEEEEQVQDSARNITAATTEQALQRLKSAIVEVEQALIRINSSSDMRPRLLGIVMKSSVWLGYTGTVLSTVLYTGITFFLHSVPGASGGAGSGTKAVGRGGLGQMGML
eukprot:g496.t1